VIFEVGRSSTQVAILSESMLPNMHAS